MKQLTVLHESTTLVCMPNINTIVKVLEIPHDGVYQISSVIKWGKGYGLRYVLIKQGGIQLSGTRGISGYIEKDYKLNEDYEVVVVEKEVQSQLSQSIESLHTLKQGDVLSVDLFCKDSYHTQIKADVELYAQMVGE